MHEVCVDVYTNYTPVIICPQTKLNQPSWTNCATQELCFCQCHAQISPLIWFNAEPFQNFNFRCWSGSVQRKASVSGTKWNPSMLSEVLKKHKWTMNICYQQQPLIDTSLKPKNGDPTLIYVQVRGSWSATLLRLQQEVFHTFLRTGSWSH